MVLKQPDTYMVQNNEVDCLSHTIHKNYLEMDHKLNCRWAWWCMPVIPTLRRLRQEDLKLRSAWTT
jgi:hypothetical protein